MDIVSTNRDLNNKNENKYDIEETEKLENVEKNLKEVINFHEEKDFNDAERSDFSVGYTNINYDNFLYKKPEVKQKKEKSMNSDTNNQIEENTLSYCFDYLYSNRGLIKNTEAIIVGAGPVGCYLAIQLRMNGFQGKIIMYERYLQDKRNYKIVLPKVSDINPKNKIIEDLFNRKTCLINEVEGILMKIVKTLSDIEIRYIKVDDFNLLEILHTQTLSEILDSNKFNIVKIEKQKLDNDIIDDTKSEIKDDRSINIKDDISIVNDSRTLDIQIKSNLSINESNLKLHSNELEKFKKELNLKEDDIVEIIPQPTLFFYCDGANSYSRAYLLDDPPLIKTHFYVVQFSYDVTPNNSKKKTIEKINYFVHNRIEKYLSQDVSHIEQSVSNIDSINKVTIRMFIDNNMYLSVNKFNSKEKCTGKLFANNENIRLTGLYNLISTYIQFRCNYSEERMIPNTFSLYSFKLESYRSSKFAFQGKERNQHFFIGDSAMGVPFYRSLRNGLVSVNELIKKLMVKDEKKSDLDKYDNINLFAFADYNSYMGKFYEKESKRVDMFNKAIKLKVLYSKISNVFSFFNKIDKKEKSKMDSIILNYYQEKKN